jgi:hypothetical protein
MFKTIDESAVENRQEIDSVAVFMIAMMVCVSYSVSERFILCITVMERRSRWDAPWLGFDRSHGGNREWEWMTMKIT